MPKPRLRVRVLILLVAIAATAFGVVRWRRDRELRADLLRRAQRCEQFASALRSFRIRIPESVTVQRVDVGPTEQGVCSWTVAPDAEGMTSAEALKEFDRRAVEYERLSLAYKRAAESPWVTSVPPLSPYSYRAKPQVRGASGNPLKPTNAAIRKSPIKELREAIDGVIPGTGIGPAAPLIGPEPGNGRR